MKMLLIILSFIALSAHAEQIAQGGFGTDGASLASLPLETSVADANKIYAALDVKVDAKENKSIEVSDGSYFECEVPRRGIYKYTGGCSFGFRASAGAQVTYRAKKGLLADVSFSGELAKAVFEQLNVSPVVRDGATTKNVANLTCARIVTMKPVYKCSIVGATVMQMDASI